MPASTPRTRLIFQNSNVFVGPGGQSGTTATGAHYTGGNVPLGNLVTQLANVTQVDLSVAPNRQDLNVFGQLNRVGSIQISPPSIQMNVTYNATDGGNESKMGLNINGGSFLSGILSKASDSKNWFVSISQQGIDDNGVTSPFARDCWAVGNAFLSNYTFNAAVGQVATATVSVDALAVRAYTGVSGFTIPAVDPATSTPITTWNFQLPVAQTITGGNNVFALRPGDITLEFPSEAGFLVPLSGSNAVHVQSVSISMPISREVLNRLGSALGFSREIQFPLNATMQISALMTDLQTGSFSALYCNDSEHSLKMRLKQPACPGTASPDAMIWNFNAAKLQNFSLGQTVGGNATVDLTLTAQLAGSLSTAGITLSGYYGQ